VETQSEPASAFLTLYEVLFMKKNYHAEYQNLVTVYSDFRQFQKPIVKNGVPDYSPAAMKRQARDLKKYQKRLAAINISCWPVAKQVDYHLVRAQMNGLEFNHRIMRPWFRDPAFYVAISFQFGPKMHGTISSWHLREPEKYQDELCQQFRAVPLILEQARENLTEGCSDLATLGIRSKQREAAIMKQVIAKLSADNSVLLPEAKNALKAINEFRLWLEQNRAQMDAPSGIGIKNYNWHLKHVQLVPYDWHDMLVLSQREYRRAIAFLKLTEHRNRNRPELVPAAAGEDITSLFRRARRDLWRYLNAGDILTPPDYMKPRTAGKAAGKAEDHQGKRDYFVNVLHRDPLPLIPHDVVGHTPDMIRRSRDRRPIRGTHPLYFIDSFRAEGLATGIEEILMMSGMLDKRPRSIELTYNLVAHRAARSISDLKMHSNEFSLKQAFEHNVKDTPYGWVLPDSTMMWHDVELYLRQPSYGTSYTIGSTQMQQLIADYAITTGKKFTLKKCLDRFLKLGMIPITLARWEMTGRDDEMKQLVDAV
jgi:hypothetical protein